MVDITRRTLLAATAAGTLFARESSSPITVGFVGGGHRAWAHIATLKAIPGFRIAAIADPTPAFRDKAMTLIGPGAAAYDDYVRMVSERSDLQAVYVVTPGGLHADPSIAALNRGLHVLCEKPMATSISDANRMLAAAAASGKVFQIGQQMRYTPFYEKLRQLVVGGEVGPVRYVSGNLFRGDWNPQSWRVVDPRTGKPTIWRFLSRYTGSSLLEDGLHELDVLNWIVGGPVQRVYATGGNNVFKDRETIDHAAVSLTYENGVKLDFGFSIFAGSAGEAGRQMTIIGENGVLHLQQGNITLLQKGKQPKAVPVEDTSPQTLLQSGIGRELDAGTYRQSVAFLESIRTGTQPLASGAVGLEAVRTSLLAELSIRQGRIVQSGDLPA